MTATSERARAEVHGAGSMSTAALASFLARLRYRDIPPPAIAATKRLLLDWISCALAGKGARPVEILEAFARRMGPTDGPSEILVSRGRSSPLFAALVNAAASHVVEQDDLHNASIMHPATVVFPAALACAQASGADGKAFLTGCVAGYEAATRVGEFLGPSHYRVFHTTGTAGTLGAAAAVASVLGADEGRMLDALGSAGTQAAGLWEFLRDAADSKQLHTAKAAADGLLAAYVSLDGFTAAKRVLEGEQGMGAGLSRETRPERLTQGLGEKWAVCETSIKFHACCRHTHPAADALAALMREHALDHRDIDRVSARVYRAAADVLGAVERPRTVHQAKFSMGFVLALIARDARAGIHEFSEESIRDPELLDLAERVRMVVDPEIEAAYPDRWCTIVEVLTRGGSTLSAKTDVPRGDPGNPLSAQELRDKAGRLAAFKGGASPAEMDEVASSVEGLEAAPAVGFLLGAAARSDGASPQPAHALGQ